MKRRLWGSFLVFLLAACSSSPADLPQAANTFSFTVDPTAQSVDLVSAPAALSTQAEDGSRVLVPGEDLSLESYTFVFLPGNLLVIDAVFKNVSDQTFTNLSFSRGAGSDNIVNSTEPDVVATLAPGASTGTLRFEVQHRGQSFTYEVEATATVETGGADCADPVTIPDEVLRQAVRDALNKPEGDITCADMASLTELRQRGRQGENGIPNRFVENLEGLQYAVKLTTLQLMGNLTLNDVTLLSTLTELTDLDLSGNRIGDIGPLSTLVNLTRLDLGFNLDIEDVSPLSNLTGLETLVLNINQITDLAPLSTLTNLRRLDLGTNFIADLGPLATNTGVGNDDDRIDLRFNCLDVSPGSQTLENVAALESRNPDVQNVFLGTQRESDEDCGRLPPPPPAEECSDPVNIPDDTLRKELRLQLQLLEDSEITCSDLLRLTEFRYQDIDVFITNLEGLQYAVNLISLEIVDGFLTDISQVSGLTKLTKLDLSRNEQIRDITPLSGLVNLRYLDLASNAIEDVSSLNGLTNLEILYLSNNPIKHISPLSGLTNLRELYLNSVAALEDYSALQNLPNLQVLNLSNRFLFENSKIVDISSLKGLTSLTQLNLSDNKISDIGSLSNLTNLSRLDLSENFVRDLSPLVANTGLGNGEDSIELGNNCLDTSPKSQASQDAAVIEARNPSVDNVFGFDVPKLPSQCN